MRSSCVLEEDAHLFLACCLHCPLKAALSLGCEVLQVPHGLCLAVHHSLGVMLCSLHFTPVGSAMSCQEQSPCIAKPSVRTNLQSYHIYVQKADSLFMCNRLISNASPERVIIYLTFVQAWVLGGFPQIKHTKQHYLSMLYPYTKLAQLVIFQVHPLYY